MARPGRIRQRLGLPAALTIALGPTTLALNLWWGLREPLSDLFQPAGTIAWAAVVRLVVADVGCSMMTILLVLVGARNAVTAALLLSAVVSLVLTGSGVAHNAMSEFYDSSGVRWLFLAARYLQVFLSGSP